MATAAVRASALDNVTLDVPKGSLAAVIGPSGSGKSSLLAVAAPGRDYRELTGGPLYGQLIEVTGWTEEEITTGAYLITPHNAYGPGGRASYGPALATTRVLPVTTASATRR